MKRKHKLLVNVIIAVLAFVYFFISTPMLNPIYPEGAFFWGSLATIYIAINQIMNLKGLKLKVVNGAAFVDYDKSQNFKISKIAIVLVIAIWAVYAVVLVVSSPLFFYKTYRDQMAEPTVLEFSEDIQAVDLNQIPIVDKNLAVLLADKKLGEKPSLGSQVRLGDPTIQNVNGELIWVVPLHHSGFFKWITNLQGSAGYIKVSATNLQDVEYVEDYKIKIQPDLYLFDDLKRHLRFGAGAFTGITDYSFELDDDGNPYWVVTTYKNLRGFALPEATGVILVDAQNGDMQKYSIEEVPEWVDRVQPEDFIVEQINNKGEYVHGIFNFSNKDKFKSSAGEIIVYNEGRCYLFTGITSVGADNSALGFMMVDMVTKEPVIYNMSGATEYAAMGSAEGKVQDLGYSATFPLIINVQGQPTYFSTLKDNAGLIKKYAFISVKDYATVGVGDTVRAAQEDYLKTMTDMGVKPDFDTETDLEQKEITGTVSRINWNVVDNITTYAILIEEEPNMIFTVDASLSSKIMLTQEGDSITITYKEAEIGVVNGIIEFENNTIG